MKKYILNEDGQLHCENEPAVVWEDGTREWWLNGKPHREGGPAREWCDGLKEWLINGEYHRVDGPAIEDGEGEKEWFIHGEEVTEEEFKEVTYLLDVIKTL